MENAYIDSFDQNSSKIGGYPAFEQSDPREYKRSENFVLLLMIGNETMKDIGILNFFIKQKDLVNKDFSNIFSYFDND